MTEYTFLRSEDLWGDLKYFLFKFCFFQAGQHKPKHLGQRSSSAESKIRGKRVKGEQLQVGVEAEVGVVDEDEVGADQESKEGEEGVVRGRTSCLLQLPGVERLGDRP